MVFSEYTKLKVLYLWSLKCKPPAIAAMLEVEGIQVDSNGVAKFIQRYLQTGKLLRICFNYCFSKTYIINAGIIARQPGSGRRSLVQAVIEEQMRQDDETTASQLHVLLVSLGYRLNLRTVLCCRTALG